MLDVLSGMFTLLRDVQRAKACISMRQMLSGSVTLVIFVFPLNALGAILITPSGTITSPVHSSPSNTVLLTITRGFYCFLFSSHGVSVKV